MQYYKCEMCAVQSNNIQLLYSVHCQSMRIICNAAEANVNIHTHLNQLSYQVCLEYVLFTSHVLTVEDIVSWVFFVG